MRSLDVPQANDLDSVRAVVRAVARGANSLQAVEDFTQFSSRHTQYRVHAARVLSLLRLEGDVLEVTTLGERLDESDPHGTDERQVFFDAIERSPVMQVVAPDLLSRTPPTLDELTERLFKEHHLARSTAKRRASGLLTWRRRVLGATLAAAPTPGEPAKQLQLF